MTTMFNLYAGIPLATLLGRKERKREQTNKKIRENRAERNMNNYLVIFSFTIYF